MNPLFFLCYARDDDADGQRPVRAFYDDLVLEVAHRCGIERTGLGFIDTDMRASERWKPQVGDALCRAQLFLCLMSPNLLRSTYCGREWGLFEFRMQKAKRDNRILPVVWLPTTGGFLPSFVTDIQFGFDADSYNIDRQEALARYRQRGLRDLAYRRDDSRVKYMYRTVVEEIAQRIIEISGDSLDALSNRDIPELDRIVPKFPTSSRTPETPVAETEATPPRRANVGARDHDIAVTEQAWDSDDLGQQTVASTRDDPEAWSAIASITGLSKRRVGHSLRDADGRARVWKVFEDHWPDASSDVVWDIDELGSRTAASIRDEASAIAALSAHTGVHERWVKRRLNAANGRTKVHTVFSNEWSREIDDEEPEQSPEETPGVMLGMLTAATARAHQDVIDAIGELIEMSPRWVRRLLNAASGRTLVRNVFVSYWPESDDPIEMTVADVGAQRAAWVRDDDSLVETIAKLIEMDVRWVRRHLNSADGRMFVRNIFSDRWPATSVESSEWDLDALGTLTAASAREDEELIEAIAAVIHLDGARVQRRLANAHGRTHVRKVFSRYWPETEDEDDEDMADAETLGAYSAATARDDEEVIGAIADLLGLSPRRVQRALANADGRNRVRTVFAARWP